MIDNAKVIVSYMCSSRVHILESRHRILTFRDTGQNVRWAMQGLDFHVRISRFSQCLLRQSSDLQMCIIKGKFDSLAECARFILLRYCTYKKRGVIRVRKMRSKEEMFECLKFR